jgi:hypothetical protein
MTPKLTRSFESLALEGAMLPNAMAPAPRAAVFKKARRRMGRGGMGKFLSMGGGFCH